MINAQDTYLFPVSLGDWVTRLEKINGHKGGVFWRVAGTSPLVLRRHNETLTINYADLFLAPLGQTGFTVLQTGPSNLSTIELMNKHKDNRNNGDNAMAGTTDMKDTNKHEVPERNPFAYLPFRENCGNCDRACDGTQCSVLEFVTNVVERTASFTIRCGGVQGETFRVVKPAIFRDVWMNYEPRMRFDAPVYVRPGETMSQKRRSRNASSAAGTSAAGTSAARTPKVDEKILEFVSKGDLQGLAEYTKSKKLQELANNTQTQTPSTQTEQPPSSDEGSR